jgi:class 3 adenylate cyclase
MSTLAQEQNLIVAFIDICGFAKFTESMSDEDTFQLISEFTERTGESLQSANGRVIKFIGDAALITFPDEDPATTVKALRKLKTDIDDWLESTGHSDGLAVRAHIGPVISGMIGTKDDKQFDIIGKTVNQTAMLKGGEFVLSEDLQAASSAGTP